MSHHFHLSCRKVWYYLRFRIPQDLISLIKRREICKSLKTRDKKVAQIQQKIYMAQASQLFLLARSGMLNAQSQKAIDQTSQGFQKLSELLKCTEDFGNLRPLNTSETSLLMDKHRKALVNRDYSSIENEVQMICEENQLTLIPKTSQYNLFCRELLKSKITDFEKELMHLDGNYNLLPTAQPIQSSDSQTIQKILDHVTKPIQPCYSEVVKRYLRMKEQADGMENRVIVQYQSHFDCIQRIIGDRPVNEYTDDDFMKARENLRKLPSTTNQSERYKNMSIEEILAEGPHKKLYAERTQLKFLDKMNSLFKHAAAKDYIRKSLCPAWKASKELEDDEGYAAFSKEDLERFFQTSYFSRPAVRIKNPENFWIAPIGLYSGLRIGEIAQLYVEDIREIDGIWCFDLNRKKDKFLKTKNSKRIVPIHNFLLEMGFLEYVKTVKDQRLWSKLKWIEKAGYGKDISNRMAKNIRRNVTDDTDKVFHSFRNTFAEQLNQVGNQPDENIACVLGHEVQYKITKKYRGEKATQVLADIVNSFDPGVDLNHLL
ncbi:MAG: site-specific integrase [Desulfuromusa sp.]|nr:site-specific integrase [Desulfuromusa sp.]